MAAAAVVIPPIILPRDSRTTSATPLAHKTLLPITAARLSAMNMSSNLSMNNCAQRQHSKLKNDEDSVPHTATNHSINGPAASSSSSVSSSLSSSAHNPVRPGIAPLVTAVNGRRRALMTATKHVIEATGVEGHRQVSEGSLSREINNHSNDEYDNHFIIPRSTPAIPLSNMKAMSTSSSRSGSSSIGSNTRSSSSSSIIHAIDYAYPASTLDSSRRGRSSMSVTSSCADSNYSTSPYDGDPNDHPGLSRSSSSATSTTSSSASCSVSSRRSSSSTSSSSISLACQFRNWTFTSEDQEPILNPPLKTADVDSTLLALADRQKPSLSLIASPSSLLPSNTRTRQSISLLSCSPESFANATTGDVFSPLTDVPPLPPSVFPPGISSEHHDDEDIEDVDGIVCFQPGW